MSISASTDLPSYVTMLLEGYSEQTDYGVLRSEMDGSLAKTRPRYSTPIVTRDIELFIESKDNYIAFRNWFSTNLVGGSVWFNFTDNLTQTVKIGRFVETKIQWMPLAPEKWKASTKIETLGL